MDREKVIKKIEIDALVFSVTSFLCLFLSLWFDRLYAIIPLIYTPLSIAFYKGIKNDNIYGIICGIILMFGTTGVNQEVKIISGNLQ